MERETGHDDDDDDQVEEMVNEEEDDEFLSAMRAQDRAEEQPAPITGSHDDDGADTRNAAVARGKQREGQQQVR